MPDNPEMPMSKQLLLLVLAGVIGVLGASVAQGFLYGIDELQHLYLHTLPEALGWDGPSGWQITLGLLVSAGLIVVAQKLPGNSGKSPLTGFHFDTPLRSVPGILLAAAATLIFGASLGPEAPLIIVGSSVAAIIMRKSNPTVLQLAMFLGGIAAIGSIFGNPFVTAFMILEFVALGVANKAVLMPAFVALGGGYLVQVGWGSWLGLGLHSLSVPGLPNYEHLEPGDLVVGLAVAVVTALLVGVTRGLGERINATATNHAQATITVAALATAGIAVAAVSWFGVDYEQILYSGQSAMPSLIAETSVATIIAIVVGKLLVYGIALGSGFRGGPIFPATYIGVAFGVLAALLITGVCASPLTAAGIAAASTVMTRLPFTSALLAMLLVGGAGTAIAPFAILGAVAGFVVRQALDMYENRNASASPATV